MLLWAFDKRQTFTDEVMLLVKSSQKRRLELQGVALGINIYHQLHVQQCLSDFDDNVWLLYLEEEADKGVE